VRLTQPLLYAAVLLVAMTIVELDAPRVIALFGATLLLQAGLAWWLYRKLDLPRGKFSRPAAGSMLRYGIRDFASTAPNALNGRLDVVVLALMVPSAALGQYAVAVSLSVIASPIAAAFGNVAFPRIAQGDRSGRTVVEALRGSYIVAVVGVGAVVLAGPVLVPVLYGRGFDGVPRLLFVLAPGAALYLVNLVMSDLLRGLGRPGLVARCEWVGVACTIAGLMLLVPHFGAVGAAATSSVTYVAVHLLLRRFVRSAAANGMAATVARDGRLASPQPGEA
jgi:O-antigen/teichoic acid export membrane protein